MIFILLNYLLIDVIGLMIILLNKNIILLHSVRLGIKNSDIGILWIEQ